MKKEYYCKPLDTREFDVLDKIQRETDNLNSPLSNKETELVILKFRKRNLQV